MYVHSDFVCEESIFLIHQNLFSGSVKAVFGSLTQDSSIIFMIYPMQAHPWVFILENVVALTTDLFFEVSHAVLQPFIMNVSF